MLNVPPIFLQWLCTYPYRSWRVWVQVFTKHRFQRQTCKWLHRLPYDRYFVISSHSPMPAPLQVRPGKRATSHGYSPPKAPPSGRAIHGGPNVSFVLTWPWRMLGKQPAFPLRNPPHLLVYESLRTRARTWATTGPREKIGMLSNAENKCNRGLVNVDDDLLSEFASSINARNGRRESTLVSKENFGGLPKNAIFLIIR